MRHIRHIDRIFVFAFLVLLQKLVGEGLGVDGFFKHEFVAFTGADVLKTLFGTQVQMPQLDVTVLGQRDSRVVEHRHVDTGGFELRVEHVGNQSHHFFQKVLVRI